jgi:thiol-disulfide isomerase/thioredoxin
MRVSVALSVLLAALAGCVPVLESGDLGPHEPWAAPDNGWPVGTPPEDLRGEGFYVGQVIPDFRLVDQYGDTVSMWQFHGQVVVVDVSTMWCGPCRELARHAEPLYQEYVDAGLIYVTVLPENVHGGEPTVDDLGLWADQYDLTSPVVADPGKAWAGPPSRRTSTRSSRCSVATCGWRPDRTRRPTPTSAPRSPP